LECTRRRQQGVRSLHEEDVEEEASLAPHPQSIALDIGVGFHQWCRRWRLEWGIALKIPGEELQRTRVLLAYIHRARHLWQHCHPGNHMRPIALDQVPMWFHDVGYKRALDKKRISQPAMKEHFSPIRERYTTFTSIATTTTFTLKDTPKVAILSKGREKEKIKSKLQSPIRVQCQECGSYLLSDVVEALGWIPPRANAGRLSYVGEYVV
jgi:hypothetical protein